MTTVYLILALTAAISASIVWQRRRRRRALDALQQTPLPAGWIRILEEKLPIYLRLPADLRSRLHGHIQVFVATKSFEPCGGLAEITDEMMVIVAAQACLLLLNGRNGNFERLESILLYPDAYRASESIYDQPDGGDDVRLGESWSSGSVVLSWHHVLHGVDDPRDGCNVVLHEFAHQLDQIDGSADGLPLLKNRSLYPRWQKVFSAAYDLHVQRAEAGRRTVIDSYGATDPAEFFAVATETFFEKPRVLKKRYPDLYDELASFYELDPLTWD